MSSSSDEPRPPGDEPASNGRLDSWKEIAAYLRRSVRSAKRWEKEEGLPIRRHLHGKRDSVYAYRAELDGWWESRGANLSDQNGAEEVAPVTEEPFPAEAPAIVTASEPAAGPSLPPGKSRTAALVAVGLFVTLLIAAAWVSQHNSRAAARRPPLPFQNRDWVLVAAFENRTGQPLLDGTLEYALQRELGNSRYVNVVPRERIGDALRLMRKPLETRVDAAIGREVCIRDGDIRALITGRIERLGSKYFLSVELADPSKSAAIASVAENAASEEQLLPATRRISDEVRAMLGENPPSIQEGRPQLLKVTTPSLRALQLYSQADALIAQNKSPAAEELLKQAVAEDPGFASAHIHLAHAIHNQNRPVEEFRPHAEAALRLSETTTEGERYFIRGSYYHLLGQREKAIAAYEALLTLYPDHFWGTGNLAGLYSLDGRFRDAVKLEVRRADLRPKDFLVNLSAAFEMAPLDPVRSRIYVRRARELVSPSVMEKFPSQVAWLEAAPAAEDWLDGNITQALQVADGLAAKIESLSGHAREALAHETLTVYLTLGRLEAAARCAQRAPDSLVRHDLLSRVAFIGDDRGALKQHLEALERATELRPTRVGLLARAGLVPQAARLMTKYEAQKVLWANVLLIPRGELSLARGEIDRGVSQLEEGTQRFGERGSWLTLMGSESLATAFKKKGDLARAVQILEEVSKKRSSAAFQRAGSLWLRNQFQLARLYRETGRGRDARTIEDELRKLLALADPDHPIRRELDRLKAS